MKSASCGLVLLLLLAACTSAQTAPAQQAPAQTQDAVVAEVSGRTITLKEVDERWQAMDPGERARVTQLMYQHRRNVLEQMVGDLVIEEAAKAANLAVPQYLEQETQKRLRPVTEADIQQFYEANKDRAQGRPLEQLRQPIEEFLAAQRQQQARAQLVDDLTKKGSAIRVLLDPPRQEVGIEPTDPVKGPAGAPITIVEYSDYQCPYCARVNPALDRVVQTYGDKVKIVFKDFPLPNHPEAPKAAEAAHCAGEQGNYWEMHDRLFANQQSLQIPQIKQYATALELDMNAFNQCLDSGKHASRVAENMKAGEALGVASTPTLYVNGRPVVGAQPFEFFKAIIDEELARIR
ncbi:MAG TPA: thioredoxin domain-containing protein [Vicinamibacterales bacterium]|nr:thioredoxin domain-containing protein [Vicinamibacterales bacterium]